MLFKDDILDAKERMSAWWDHEIVDRPIFGYNYIKGGGFPPGLMTDWDLAKSHEDIELSMDKFEESSQNICFGGESIPRYFPNYGAGIVAAIFGAKPEFKSGTVWLVHRVETDEVENLLENTKLNDNNEWYSRLKRITEYAAKRAEGKYQVAITDLGGILDILASFLGPQKMVIAMKRNQSLIDTCRSIILEKTLKVFDELQDIIESYGHNGCDSWLNIWCPSRYYTMQCDISAIMSPKYFRRFALPDLIAQAEHMDYAMYHLDGPGQLVHVDDLISSPAITGIQWVPGFTPGQQQPGSDKWFPLYKKIQRAGKNIQINVAPHAVSHLFNNLESKGLFVRTYYFNEDHAYCYIPKFMNEGGDGGETVQRISESAKKKNLETIDEKNLSLLLSENDLVLGNLNKRLILEESNKKLKKLNEN